MAFKLTPSIVTAAFLSVCCATGAQAAIIETTPFWNGSSDQCCFGGSSGSSGTGVFGETFIAPAQNVMTSFTFEVNDHDVALTHVVAQIYEWIGAAKGNASLLGGLVSEGALGPALFTSAPFAIPPEILGFHQITVNTDNTVLVPGRDYVALLADTGDDAALASFGLIPNLHPVPGGFNFFNNNHTLASISGRWDDGADFGSLAWVARFSSPAPSVPLPAALPLFATGLGAIGLLGWRRKRKAQAA